MPSGSGVPLRMNAALAPKPGDISTVGVELVEVGHDGVVERRDDRRVEPASSRSSVASTRAAAGGGLAAALDLDVQRHVREALDELGETRHGEVVGRVAGRRRTFAGADAAVDVVAFGCRCTSPQSAVNQ